MIRPEELIGLIVVLKQVLLQVDDPARRLENRILGDPRKKVIRRIFEGDSF